MAIFYPFVMDLFWSANTGTHARSDLRIVLLLKTLSFTFSALQLRHGYPPPASYRSVALNMLQYSSTRFASTYAILPNLAASRAGFQLAPDPTVQMPMTVFVISA